MTAYYNEVDPFAAAWLRNLVEAELVAPGEVDERSIEDVTPNDLRGFTQCHFFAGIGVWSYALRRAGWPDDRPVWTGSCPCQPFSAAGKRGGAADERHLWPAFFHLIELCRPAIVLGEQVASKDGLAWLDTVSADMEGTGYAFGASDLCAAGVGAPHIRQRLWFVGVADSVDGRCEGQHPEPRFSQGQDATVSDGVLGCVCEPFARSRLADAEHDQQRSGGGTGCEDAPWYEPRIESCGRGQVGRVDDSSSARQLASGVGPESEARDKTRLRVLSEGCDAVGRPGPTNGHWRDADWLLCRDERWRPVGPGTFPLVNGAPSRVGRLRAYGNALVAEAAAAFIGAVMGA